MHASQTQDARNLAELREISCVAAHEIRNRLARMTHAATRLDSKLRPDTEEHELLKILLSSTQQLQEIVADLLLRGRAERPQKKVGSLQRLLEDVVDETGELPLFRGVEIERVGPDFLMHYDRVALRPVFFNILLNAAEAMAGKGLITISTGREPPPGGCVIVIRDNGPGIPPYVRQHAFDLFFTTKRDGTGIGLAFVRRVLESHDWEVTLRCPARGGTEVAIGIPQSDLVSAPPRLPAQPLERPLERLPQRPGRSKNVLVVDDDHTTRELLTRFLNDDGYRAEGVGTSDQALDVCRSFEPDVLLSDWFLENGRKGVCLARELRGFFPELAVIFQSGLEASELASRLNGEQFSFSHILTKPIRLRTLKRVLSEA